MQEGYAPELLASLAQAVRADLLLGKGWERAEVETGPAGTVVKGSFGDEAWTVVPLPGTDALAPKRFVEGLAALGAVSTIVAFVDSDGAISYCDLERVPDATRGVEAPHYFAEHQ